MERVLPGVAVRVQAAAEVVLVVGGPAEWAVVGPVPVLRVSVCVRRVAPRPRIRPGLHATSSSARRVEPPWSGNKAATVFRG